MLVKVDYGVDEGRREYSTDPMATSRYGFGYGHGIRYDKYDNLWVVDKGTHAAVRINPAGYVTLNLGRRPEGPDEPDYYVPVGRGQAPPHVDGYFGGPTDVAFDSDEKRWSTWV